MAPEQGDRAGAELPIINIKGEKVGLGPLSRDLLPTYQRWVNDFSTLRTLAMVPSSITAEAEAAWYERAACGSEHDVYFTIYELSAQLPIGNAALHEVNHRDRSAELGIFLGEPQMRGRGYGTEAVRLLLDYAFTALGLHNVMLRVYEFNPEARRAYEKAGFKEIGRRRQGKWMGGRLWDEIYMDCLASEFESPVLAKVFAPDKPRSDGIADEYREGG